MCLNNGKQIMLAWLQYAGDNNDKYAAISARTDDLRIAYANAHQTFPIALGVAITWLG